MKAFVLTLLAITLAAGCQAATEPRNSVPLTVRKVLTFCTAHQRLRDREGRVAGYFVEFGGAGGPDQFGELFQSPAASAEMAKMNYAPSRIRNGIDVAIPILGSHALHGGIRTASWVVLKGKLSCYPGLPRANITVQSVHMGKT